MNSQPINPLLSCTVTIAYLDRSSSSLIIRHIEHYLSECRPSYDLHYHIPPAGDLLRPSSNQDPYIYSTTHLLEGQVY